MAVMRERPYSGAHFLVAIGDADSRSSAAGFADVVFPVFTHADAGEHRASAASTATDSGAGRAAGAHLVLRRGANGNLDLFKWWHEARPDVAPPTRTVTIELLADDHATVVMTWRFHRAYPVSVSYSPLRASEGGVVMETVELAFDGVDVS